MTAVTIELDRIARTLTRCAAILATLLRGAGTTRVLTLVLSVIVRHVSSRKYSVFLDGLESSTSEFRLHPGCQGDGDLGGDADVVLE